MYLIENFELFFYIIMLNIQIL